MDVAKIDVFSDDDDQDAIVLFSMALGTYALEIGYMETGAMLDAIVISRIDSILLSDVLAARSARPAGMNGMAMLASRT